MPSGLTLDLADGQRWLIRPLDDKAAAVVAELGQVMGLRGGEDGRELSVAVCSAADRPCVDSRPFVCRLSDASDRETQVIQMEQIAFTIAREALVRGGLLLHGALAEYRGSGFIMAGPGTIGKSTASRRLPPPWRSLCDDMTLVVRDGKGCFRAHPWPTWSRFHLGGPGGSWPVEQSAPLRAIFFLGQAPADQLEPVNTTQAAALTLESAADLAWVVAHQTDEGAVRTLCGDAVRAARVLVSEVPAYTFKLSLDGRFWEEIERVLPVGDLHETGESWRDRRPASVGSLIARDSRRLVYTGTSMNPTLVEPELLHVRPYEARRVRPGDVVCFKSPDEDVTVVHRVVSVGRPEDRILTRGDNSTSNDPWVLKAGDIIGRVEAAQRGAERRPVPGGWRGLVVLRWVRLARGILRHSGLVPHKIFCLVAGLGPFDRLLPRSLRPRVVRFDVRCRVFLKLLSGKRTVGQYDDRRGEWCIRRLYRLFIDTRALPCPGSAVQSPEPR
jgi:SynChlorMet cassette protein ScmC